MTDVGIFEMNGRLVQHIEIKQASLYQHAIGKVLDSGKMLRQERGLNVLIDSILLFVASKRDEDMLEEARCSIAAQGITYLGWVNMRESEEPHLSKEAKGKIVQCKLTG